MISLKKIETQSYRH